MNTEYSYWYYRNAIPKRICNDIIDMDYKMLNNQPLSQTKNSIKKLENQMLHG